MHDNSRVSGKNYDSTAVCSVKLEWKQLQPTVFAFLLDVKTYTRIFPFQIAIQFLYVEFVTYSFGRSLSTEAIVQL